MVICFVFSSVLWRPEFQAKKDSCEKNSKSSHDVRRIRGRSRKMSGLSPCKEGAYLNKGNETASVPFCQHLEIVSNFNFLEIRADVFDEVLII